MLTELHEISRRLIEKYDHDRIILFGSRTEEKDCAGNDIDLLIVKETDKKPLDRLLEVEMLLSDRAVPLDVLVYTPDEVRRLYALGSPFIEEVMEKGRLLYMRKATLEWLRDAEQELESASVLYEHKKYGTACYHTQQSVKKGLKAVIIEQGRKLERTHDIIELYNAVTGTGFDARLSMEDAVYLNRIYKGRYPTEEGLLPHGEPSRADAERALLAAKRLMERLKGSFEY
jgi:HEPN domain-containing protein/predicted nucleotidyltransferase